MLELDVGVLASDLFRDLMEQTVGHLHDVVLRERRDLLPVVGTGVFEGIARDALTPRSRDELETLVDLIGLSMLDARVQILFVLADDDDIHTRVFGCNEWRVGGTRSDVGVEAQGFSYRHVETLETSTLRCGDRRLEEHTGAPQ